MEEADARFFAHIKLAGHAFRWCESGMLDMHHAAAGCFPKHGRQYSKLNPFCSGVLLARAASQWRSDPTARAREDRAYCSRPGGMLGATFVLLDRIGMYREGSLAHLLCCPAPASSLCRLAGSLRRKILSVRSTQRPIETDMQSRSGPHVKQGSRLVGLNVEPTAKLHLARCCHSA